MALSLGPAGAGSGASASSIDLPSLTPPTDLSTKLREGIKTGWIEYPDGTKTKVGRTVRVVPGLGIFIRDKTTPALETGSFATAYKVQGYYEDGSPLQGSFVLLKLNPKQPFDIAPFNLLASIPQSPFLRGRPYKIFQHLSSKGETHSSIITDLLGPSLYNETLMNPDSSYLAQWDTLLKGLLSAAKGLKTLHQRGLVHRNVKIEKISAEIKGITLGGLFDYGTLIRAGEFNPPEGAPLDRLPPEFLSIIKHFNPCLRDTIRKIFHDRHGSTAQSLFERPYFNPDTDNFPITPTRVTGTKHSLKLSYQYQPSFDIFTLGYQFDVLANSFSMERTDLYQFQRESGLTKERQGFINRMQNLDPLKRPSIDEVVAFLEEYNLSRETSRYFPPRAEKQLAFTRGSTCFPPEAKESLQQMFLLKRLNEGLTPSTVGFIDGKRVKTAQTKRTIPGLGVFIRDKEKAPLGAGAFATAYHVKGYHEDGTLLPRSFVLLKINPEKPFTARPFELLSSLPESPFLGGRPYKIFQHISSKQKQCFSMIMDFLGPDLVTKLIDAANTGISAFDQWKLLIKGLLDAAKGLEILHQKGLVHRDARLANISTGIEETAPGGIFDYGTIIPAEEFGSYMGAPLQELPPEILQAMSYFNISIEKKVEKIFRDRSTSIAHLLFNRPPGPTPYLLPITPFQLTELQKSKGVSFQYHPSFDIFTLGYQFDFLANSFPILSRAAVPEFQLTLKLTEKVILFINNMQHPNPLNRPSIREVITFLEEYKLYINT